MSLSNGRRIWWWVGSGAAVTIFLAAAMRWTLDETRFSHPTAANDVRIRREPSVVVTRIDKHTDAGEQAILFDPKPMFLPTEWNSYERPVPAEVMRQPGEVFRTFEPKPLYGGTELALPVPALPSAPRFALDLLKEPLRQPLIGFGREDIAIAFPPARKGAVKVSEMASGAVGLPAPNLGDDAAPPTDHRDWQPVELLCAINSAGMVGRPMVTASSQIQEVDAYFRDYLVNSFHLGERLAPGFYVVVVGP